MHGVDRSTCMHEARTRSITQSHGQLLMFVLVDVVRRTMTKPPSKGLFGVKFVHFGPGRAAGHA